MRTSRQGLRFDGYTGYVEIDDSDKLKGFTQGFSVEAWVKPTAQGSRIADKSTNSSGGGGFYLLRGSSGNVSFRSGGRPQLDGTQILHLNVWRHVVVTISASGYFAMFIDSEVDITDESYGLPSVSTANLRIGDATNTADRKFIGCISNVRIYNRALSASEVAANYAGNVTHSGLVGEWLLNEGTGNIAHDTSGNGNNGTIYGATWLQKRPSRVLGVRMKPRKNMIPPFTDSRWGINEFATVISDYELVLNSDAAYRFTTIDLKVVPYQKYYLDFISNGTCQVRVGASTILFGKGSFTPQMPEISIRLYNPGSVAGTYTFTNCQLEPGTEATEWEPYVLVPDLKPV